MRVAVYWAPELDDPLHAAGSIVINSEQGLGTEVVVTFPALSVADSETFLLVPSMLPAAIV